jgi:hypothetical protein
MTEQLKLDWEVTLRPKKGSVQIASVRPGNEERGHPDD